MSAAAVPPLARAARRRRHSVRTDQRLRAGVRRPAGRGASMVLETDHPVLGRLRTLGSPIKLSATPADATRRAPLLGEHTDEVLGEFGLERRGDRSAAGKRERSLARDCIIVNH